MVGTRAVTPFAWCLRRRLRLPRGPLLDGDAEVTRDQSVVKAVGVEHPKLVVLHQGEASEPLGALVRVWAWSGPSRTLIAYAAMNATNVRSGSPSSRAASRGLR
jgi:hypothetical protein